MLKGLSCFILVLTLISCNPKREVSSAFYFWKSTFKLSQSEQEILANLKVKKLYVKYFDVDWDSSTNQAMPKAIIQFQENFPLKVELVPTIFITNRTLKNIPSSNINPLAINILSKIKSINKTNKFVIKEIQLDCDWSDETRTKYFHLIKLIKRFLEESAIKVSSTIRLHQIKYFQKTGVPPVDRGILMFYNMGKWNDPNTINSILDLDIAKKYLVNFDQYPLKLDVALPLYSWGIQFRNNKGIRILYNLTQSNLQNNKKVKQLKPNLYQIKENTYINGYYLYKNDQIRLEEASQKNLKSSAEILDKIIKNDYIIIAYYHLDEEILKDYDLHVLEKIQSQFN